MSVPTIAPYFPFRRIKIVKQSLLPDISEARISAEPDKRFHPICHCCGKKVTATHSWTQRTIRDLNLAATRVWITCRYRKLFCTHCRHISIEDLDLFHPYLRVTHRLSLYIHQHGNDFERSAQTHLVLSFENLGQQSNRQLVCIGDVPYTHNPYFLFQFFISPYDLPFLFHQQWRD